MKHYSSANTAFFAYLCGFYSITLSTVLWARIAACGMINTLPFSMRTHYYTSAKELLDAGTENTPALIFVNFWSAHALAGLFFP
jgi:hypothetical protein